MDVERVIDTVTERVLDSAIEPIPCPLCGLMPSIVQSIVSVDDRSWSVACLHCRISATAGTKHDAIILWNDTASREGIKDDRLKECPFCGNEEVEMLEFTDTAFVICCPKCYTTGPQGTTEDEAIEKWNRRVE